MIPGGKLWLVVESAEARWVNRLEDWLFGPRIKPYLRKCDTLRTMNKLTSPIYWASLDPIVAKLQHMPAEQRFDYANQIMKRGYIVDAEIQVRQAMNPEDVMQVRLNNGFTWVPSADQPNIPTMPGADLPGQPHYNPEPPFPPKSIVVSVDAADYPPFDGVIPQKPKPIVGEGIQTANGTIYLAGPGADMSSLSEGQVITQDVVDYVTHYNAARNPPVTFTRKG